MAETPSSGKRLYVLDTNVLMHDPMALFRFKEQDVFLPMVVLEELDAAKKGMSEVARNVRQVSRFLDELIVPCDPATIQSGIPLRAPHGIRTEEAAGRLLVQTGELQVGSPLRNNQAPDNQILNAALALTEKYTDTKVVLVSKDINLRIRAAILGLPVEDYQNDRALDDLSLLFTGLKELPGNFWEKLSSVESWSERGRTFYRLPDAGDLVPNECLYTEGEGGIEAIVQECEGGTATLRIADDYRGHSSNVWGITARNREQNFALNLLMDPDIDFVTMLGTAGTGKTLLTLAAGLVQTLDQHRFAEIIMTRATVPVGEDIGFLPGTEEEKMTPWMGALEDNLEVLTQSDEGGDWGRAATKDLLASRIRVRSLNFMRGRTFLNRYVIIDEAQNLTPKQMKTLLTRAGPGTKMVCLGNVEQIDTPYLTETSSGLTFAVDRFRTWRHSGHVTLRRGERSRLADYASEML